MAHSRSQSQPTMQYRYRPNAPARSSTTMKPPNPAHDIESQIYFDVYPQYSKLDAMSMPHFTTAAPDAGCMYDVALASEFMEPASSFGYANNYQPRDFQHESSPHPSPWISSKSSVMSDACSSTWSSSSTSSMGFSPKPQYQGPFVMDSSYWPQESHPYMMGNCVSMQEIYPVPSTESDYIAFAMQFPQASPDKLSQLSDGHNANYGDSIRSFSNLRSSRSISTEANKSTETIVPLRTRSTSLSSTPDSSNPESSPEPCSTRKSSLDSTQICSKSRFEGQILEFSTPVAQAKSKGPKIAAIPCPLAPYGCRSSFISKNEWKRHINTQHLRLEAWICDQCPKRDNKRDFNRKDLFIQHLKRMHPVSCPAPGTKAQFGKLKSTQKKSDKGSKASRVDDLDPILLQAEQRCHKTLREPPLSSACIFCSTVFNGRGSWDARVEHVAKHMDQYKKEGSEVPDPTAWRPDGDLERWLISEGVITKLRQRWSVL